MEHRHDALKYEFQVYRQTFNILLSGWKSAEDAEAFFAEMRELGVEPDQVTHNSLIDYHCKKRDVEKAYKLLDEMRVKDISPDVITYTSLIGRLGLIGQPDKTRNLLKEMHELGCYRCCCIQCGDTELCYSEEAWGCVCIDGRNGIKGTDADCHYL